MKENTSLERAPRGQVALPSAVPVSSYPLEVESEGSTPSLIEYWRVFHKRRWTIIGVVTFVLLTATIATLKQRPVYRASAVIQIDRETPHVLNFQDTAEAEFNAYDDSYLETAYRLLESRSLAYRVIKKLDLVSLQEFAAPSAPWYRKLWPSSEPAKTSLSPEEQMEPQYTGIINPFLGKLQISPVRRSQLVEIGFESYDPATSAHVANTIASTYIDMNLESRWQATQKASDWLSQQLVGLKAKLEKSEEDLQQYAKANAILFLDEKQSMNSQKLQQLQQEATRAQADLIEKESLFNQVKDGNLTSVPGILENKLYQDLSMKLSDLKREYSDLTATFAPEYPKVQRLKSQIDETQAALDRETSSFALRVTDDYNAAANRRRLLDQAVVDQTHDFNNIADKSIQYNILKREADTNKQIYDGLLQRMKEASVSAGLRASNVRVVDMAEIPISPSKPIWILNLGLAMIMGLALAVGLVFFQEYLDNTLKSPEDVQRYLHLPTLAVIPANSPALRRKLGYGQNLPREIRPEGAAAEGNGNDLAVQLIRSDKQSALSEAYRSLRTSVLLSSPGGPPRVLLIASGHPGEGKTTTAVNLAITLAQLGGRVLIVDSDMRRPRVAAQLGLLNAAAGLSTYLAGQGSLDDVAVPTDIPDLYAIPCGPIPPNPAELLSSSLMQQLLREARAKCDYVILDSPPVLHVSDARILAAQVEAVVLVSHGAVTPRDAVRHARDQLQQVNANIIGVLLNNVDFEAVGYGYYSRYSKYGYGYGSTENNGHERRA